jgi:mono/diheme cytochrome c family protein
MRRSRCTQLLSIGWLFIAFGFTATAATDPKEQFETQIRPLLAKHCFACHTKNKLGGLELNTREGILKGGKSGPAIVPGNPDKSLLIHALTYKDSALKMPPSGPLSDEELRAMTSWIRDGAVWPEAPAASAARAEHGYVVTPEQRSFWAFRPVTKPAPPEVKNNEWVRGNIDRFILSKLEQQSLQPAREVDRRTWIRRVTLDLVGLPPTPEDVASFVTDQSPDAYEKVVDRLLASPRYGVRWARMWLDVARYSDEIIDHILGKPPSSHLYRDWVIQAFNDDMPYDLFVKAQFAGDLLTGHDTKKLLPGLTIFTEAPSDFAEDDRVDVATRGFMGLTVACAKCHDHKYDPIPTKDYYSLLGIFRSTKYREVPLAEPDQVADYKVHQAEVDKQSKQIKDFLEHLSQQVVNVHLAQSSRYMMAAWKVLGPQKQETAEVVLESNLDAEIFHRWVAYLKRPGKQHSYLKKWEGLLAAGASEEQLRQEANAFQLVATQIFQEKLEIDEFNESLKVGAQLGRDLNDVMGKTMAREKYMLWQDLAAVGNPRASTARPEPRVDGVLMFPGDKVLRFLPPSYTSDVAKMRARLAELVAARPVPYDFLTIVEDAPKPADLRVFVRGNPLNLGEEAPRGFLTVLSDLFPGRFNQGSGRLQLAEAIASPKNPLTVRVMVNRIWERHFGYGLVRTPSNFGQTGDRPVHPELLDYLSSRFMEQGWSMKKLHREIVLSTTYRLSTESSKVNADKDPDNRLHWRYPVRRLDAEALRDSMLFVSNLLDEKMGGVAVPLDSRTNKRRTIYGKISRNTLDPMLTLFDFPNPNTTSEQRIPTTVPLQRLFLLNSPFVMEQAAALAARLDDPKLKTSTDRIQQIYQLVLQRNPSETELHAGQQFIATDGESAWTRYAQALLASNEFLYGE